MYASCFLVLSINFTTSSQFLVLEDLIGSVTQFLEGASELTLLHTVFLTGHGLHLARRTTNKCTDILALVLGESLLDEIGGDVTSLTLPAPRSLVENVLDIKTAGVLLGKSVKLLSQHYYLR